MWVSVHWLWQTASQKEAKIILSGPMWNASPVKTAVMAPFMLHVMAYICQHATKYSRDEAKKQLLSVEVVLFSPPQ